MERAGTKTAAGLVALVLLWIIVYWIWQPGTLSPAPEITFVDDREAVTETLGPTVSEVVGPQTSDNTGADQAFNRERAEQVVFGPGVERPMFREYAVRDGDTFEIIARRELGSRSLWMSIARANPLKDPRRLRAGDVIRVPVNPDNVQGDSMLTETDAAPVSDLDETPIVYLVKSGDSLSSIAEAYYGDQGFAEFIFRENRDVLDSMDDLSIGMQLRLQPIRDDG